MPKQSTPAANKPTHRLYRVDGEGFSIICDAVPLRGRIVMRRITETRHVRRSLGQDLAAPSAARLCLPLTADFCNRADNATSAAHWPDPIAIFLHRQHTPLLQVAGEFVEATPFDHELACAKIEAQHFIADIFHRDEVGVGHLPADPQA